MRRLLLVLPLLCLACDGTEPVADAGSADAGADAGAELPPEPVIPASTGPCPDFAASGEITVEPAEGAPRRALLWISEDAQALDGPLVFYWHGAGSRPEEAMIGLGEAVIGEILALGGMVVAPYASGEAGDFPWFLTTGTGDGDLIVADELLACASETVGVDPSRIHSIGMSAGGLHTTQMGFRRASYLASTVVYSGGLFTRVPPRTDEPRNRFASLILHGGPDDVVVINFEDSSEAYFEELRRRGHFAAICNHGMQHRIPLDARADVWRFFEAHPFGASPWASEGLPADFYAACTTEL
jgi:predicted esterase